MKTSTRISEMRNFHFGRKIVCSDGDAGSLAHLVFDTPSKCLTHLGVKQCHLFGKTVDLTYDTVVRATGEGIMLRITRAELFAPLHIDLKGITIHVLDSVLYLEGNISSQLRADIVENQVQGVPGLLEIVNNLVGDDRLAADLAMALAQDPRTRDLPIGVYPRLGAVRLSGAVHTDQQKAAAEEIVQHFTGVRSVINDLLVDPKADLLPVMIPTGFETEDTVPGKYIRHTQ